MNIINIIKCQRARFCRKLWISIQKNPSIRLFFFTRLPSYYTSLRYFNTFGVPLSYSQPNDFHEKLFWLSVYWRNPLIVKCADKYKVREYLVECGCGDILNELYFVYDDISGINFKDLPEKFVMKSNRGSGNNYFCTDKTKITEKDLFNTIYNWPSIIYGVESAEYQYMKMPFKLICEKYIMEEGQELLEYQLFCFNGEPDSFLVRNDLETAGKNPFAVSYSLDWQRRYYRYNEDNFNFELPKPQNFQKMLDYAKKLAKPFPHVRVDFYEIDGKLIFGELTFTTHGNVFSNYKPEVLKMWGDKLQLPPKYKYRDAY